MTKTSDFSALKWGIIVGVLLSLILLLIPWRNLTPTTYQEYTNNWAVEFESYSHPRVYNYQEYIVLLIPGQQNKVRVLLKSNGELLWETIIGGLHTNIAPPVLEDNKLYILADGVFKIWDLARGNLLKKFELGVFEHTFDYHTKPVFWTDKDSLLIQTEKNICLVIGKQNYSLVESDPLSEEQAKVLWMNKILPRQLKDYNLTNFKKIPPFWYNFQDSVFIDWKNFGEPMAIVSDSQLLIKTASMIVSKWDFKNNTTAWKQTFGNGVQAEYLYHQQDQQNCWMVWKHNKQVAFAYLDLASGQILNHGVATMSYDRVLKEEKIYSIITNYQTVHWIDLEQPTNNVFRQYNIEDFKPIRTTMDKKSVYIISEKKEKEATYTEPRTYLLKSFDLKNIE